MLCVGAIPNSVCQLTSLTYLSLSSNAGITCAPSCVTSITSSNLYVPSTACPSNQANGLCGLIAATNINSISSYSQWSCTTGGFTSTAPCAIPVWNGLTCSGGAAVVINLYNIGLTGNIF